MAKNLKDLIDIDLLAYFKSKLDLLFANKVDKENGKGLSTNDYTSEEKAKLANIATGAQVNTIEGVQIAGTSITPTNKIVNIPAATQSAAGAMAAADKVKLDGVASGAQVNVIESVTLHGTVLPVTNKTVNINALPSGGSDGQVLTRVGANDYSVDWVHPSTIAWHEATISGDKIHVSESQNITGEISQGKLPAVRYTDNDTTYDLFYVTGSTIANMCFCCVDSAGRLHILSSYVPTAGVEVKWSYSVTPLVTSSSLDSTISQLETAIGNEYMYFDFVMDQNGDFVTAPEPSAVRAVIQEGRGAAALLRSNTTGSDDVEILRLSKTLTSYNSFSFFGQYGLNFIELWYDSSKSAWVWEPIQYVTEEGLDSWINDGLADLLDGKVDKVEGKGLSTEDYTTAEKTKLNGIAAGAQVNVIESVKVNGTALTITSKSVNVPVPTKTSDITNDSGYITIADVPEGAAGTTTTPKMDGTATVGTETAFARGDHIHPHDTTKVDKVDGKGLSTNDYTTAEKNKLAGIAAGAQANVVTDASTTGSGASQTMTVSKGSTNYTTYTKTALDSALGSKADASTVYTKTEIDQKLAGAMNYKGTKATVSELPSSGNTQGDVWHVTADGSEWAWNGTSWEELGTLIDLSGYVEEDDIGIATTSQIDELFVTSGN